MTEPKVELPTEDVIVERVCHLDLNVVLLCEEAMHLPDAQVTRKILAARCSSTDIVAGAPCERCNVRYNGIYLHSMFGNVAMVLRPRAVVLDEVLGNAHRSVSADPCEQDGNNITKNIIENRRKSIMRYGLDLQ